MTDILSEKEISFLKDLSKEITTQDTRSTASPYGLVIGQKKRQVVDYENCDHKAIYWNETDYDTFDEFFDAIKEYYLEDGCTKEVVNYIKETCSDIDDVRNEEYNLSKMMNNTPKAYGYDIVDDFSTDCCGGNFFLTEKSAKEYIKNNNHNLSGAFTYGIHLYRNPEMKQLIEILSKIGKSL